jgi:hypothetical protein
MRWGKEGSRPKAASCQGNPKLFATPIMMLAKMASTHMLSAASKIQDAVIHNSSPLPQVEAGAEEFGASVHR